MHESEPEEPQEQIIEEVMETKAHPAIFANTGGYTSNKTRGMATFMKYFYQKCFVKDKFC